MLARSSFAGSLALSLLAASLTAACATGHYDIDDQGAGGTSAGTAGQGGEGGSEAGSGAAGQGGAGPGEGGAAGEPGEGGAAGDAGAAGEGAGMSGSSGQAGAGQAGQPGSAGQGGGAGQGGTAGQGGGAGGQGGAVQAGQGGGAGQGGAGQAGAGQGGAGQGGAGQGGSSGGSGQGGSGTSPVRRTLVSGERHTCVCLPGGAVKCWGDNLYGQLGLGDSEGRGDEQGEMGASLPAVDLGAGAVVVALAAGDAHTCALLEGGKVKCWGKNLYGQLGLGNTSDRGDDKGEMGSALPAVDLGAGAVAAAIAASGDHTCAVLSSGQVKCWGYNLYGQLGLGDLSSRGDSASETGDGLAAVDLGAGVKAVDVAAGGKHTCALLEGGRVKCWGDNLEGQLGLGNSKAYGDSKGEMGDLLPFVDLGTGAVAVELVAGSGHTCARLADGRIKCWGDALYGQIGQGSTTDIGRSAGEMGDSLPAVDLGSASAAAALATFDRHTCARLADGSVRCWGRNLYGQLGLGDFSDRGDGKGEMGSALPAVDLGPGVEARSLAAGLNHTCAALSTGQVKCWGNGGYGQLGLGDTTDRGDDKGEMGTALPTLDLGGPVSP